MKTFRENLLKIIKFLCPKESSPKQTYFYSLSHSSLNPNFFISKKKRCQPNNISFFIPLFKLTLFYPFGSVNIFCFYFNTLLSIMDRNPGRS